MPIFRTVFFFLLATCQTGILFAQTGQIALPRVAMMPNQPAPYNVRDWQDVALKYDAYVYDVQKTGQYLPLVFLQPAGLNYPQNERFGLHTYVGTNAPFGNEAINVLPSLVGASLVGVDKSNQFGKNWLLMSQDFFNKANGENLYLNNAGANSGGDWWYDMMPNVYFYQLYALYPNLGSEADWQFTTVADRLLEAVQAMGGQETPWNPAYMNYRAWKFKTMEPNTSGVPEPEAAGAFAWVLYNAWKQTGNPDYLKGAEWAMEFLDQWPSNPSYEAQLPYGTLTAAKMNAELGTNYDVEQLLNWSFDKGPLRNWGTIVGTWGGFAVSGLIGEANDAGNDYAFQMNGLQQAAALVPMLRYDKRFARSIGKWMLNLANANRLFYPGFLPASLQDASAWSAVHDPDQVIGYEALREVWQGSSPFSTGDAVQGGWAATNLALYGTGSIGYLGAIVEKTDVDKILKIDLLKTDFFGEAAYPTYLLYNSHSTLQTVRFDVGSTPVDVYEALSETFLLQNVNDTVSLSIPADEAILLTLAPVGGLLTYDKNQLLIDGRVVDYRQNTQPFSWPPRIKSLAAARNPLEVGDTTTLYVAVSDADSDQFTYQWSSSAGTVAAGNEESLFTAPLAPGSATVQCIVSDLQGNSDTATLLISLVLEINDPPQIQEIQQNLPFAAPGAILQLTCRATDPDGDTLGYAWTTTGGSFGGTDSSVSWTAPLSEGISLITVKVTDAQGLADSATTEILVKNFLPASGNRIADYPFRTNADDVSGNALHGQANGAILTADRFGSPQGAYYFNGGAQHILVANSPILNFQDAITVSCWFKANALPERETFLLSHGSWQNRWKISLTPDKGLRWTLNTLNGISDLDATLPLQTDSFYQVVVTYDGTLLALYLNGDLNAYKLRTGSMRTTSLPLLMGQMLPGQPEYNFKGVLDEVLILDYALVPDEVNLLYQAGLTALAPALSEPASFHVYPNPVSEMLTLQFPEQRDAVLQVRDLAGHLISEVRITAQNQVVLNVKNLTSGLYTITLYAGASRINTRFIKM